MNRTEIDNWIFALKLSLPIVLFCAAYLFNHSNYLDPTGFIQYDNVSYIAYAKQYLDAGSFHLQYSNPFNDHASAPIYFQPQTLLFAFLLWLGIPPGWILIPFTIVCSVVCFRFIIAIYDLLVKETENRTLMIWLFAWGGGILVLSSIAAHFFVDKGDRWSDQLFILDPAGGWWGLNLGRSLFFSCEAYYHALFMGCVYFILKKRWLISAIIVFILLFSHPFTSLELIGIILAWCLVESIIARKSVPPAFIVASVLLFLCYVLYYLVYLNQYPEHRSVAAQYSLNWRLRYYSMIPAYCIVGTLTFIAIYQQTFRNFFRLNAHRLFACWFAVAFLLANHELFIKPRQPIHFTRGYIWTSLFLLGLPALHHLITYLKTSLGKTIILAVFAVLFLTDNFLWIVSKASSKSAGPSSRYTTPEQEAIFKFINTEGDSQALLISNDENISYLSTIYTKAYPWFSHPFTTPFIAEKKAAYDVFMQRAEINHSWVGRKVFFVLMKNSELKNVPYLLQRVSTTNRIDTDNYLVLQCDSLHLKP